MSMVRANEKQIRRDRAKFTLQKFVQAGNDAFRARLCDVQKVQSFGAQTLFLSADHILLHLIHYNALLAIFLNKYLLAKTSMCFTPGQQLGDSWIPFAGEVYPGRAAIMPTNLDGLPPSLVPTTLQRCVVHSTWINIVPFPRMRDNLILWEEFFDHGAFITDVIGNFLDPEFFPHPQREMSIKSHDSTKTHPASQIGDETTDRTESSEKGLIVWGEPHNIESWEVTPGFLRRWSWALEGCEDLIAASNSRRVGRGEEPLPDLY